MLDYAKLKISAGNGGKGIVSFRREKYVPKGGPDGGDGGKGGHVYIQASNDISTLLDFQFINHFEAQSGASGGPSNKRGKDAEDLIIKVPVGSIVKVNKIIADIPKRKSHKPNISEPNEYEQKVFNYKKMKKLQTQELAAKEDAAEEEEEQDAEIMQENDAPELPFVEEETVIPDQVQTASSDTEEDTSEYAREGTELYSIGSHKVYKFSEPDRSFARALRGENSIMSRYKKEDIPTYDLDKAGEQIMIARGGVPGRGNARFKSSLNQAPKYAESAQRGEYVEIEIILKMVANVGLIGYPNAGKSTLLSKLTAASPKIANYPFTTLEPNLGVTYIDEKPVILADIPGLIEGASQGKGLGYKFLQHVERTQILLHLIEIPDLDQVSTPQDLTDIILHAYNAIRSELMQYGNNLPEKYEIIVVNKIDKIPEDQRKKYIVPLEKELQTLGKPLVFISADQDLGLNGLKKVIKDTLVADHAE